MAEQGPGTPAPAGPYSVDAHHATGVQVGDYGTQIIYSYNAVTVTDGVMPPPLISVSGDIDSPYRGLNAFEERDAAFFFGREKATDQVLKRMSGCLENPSLLVVSGVSGAGKSSLLRAGVLPRIRGAGLTVAAPESASWPCLLFTPSRAPLDELAVRVAAVAGLDANAVRQGLTTDPAGFGLTARQAALTRPARVGDRPGDQDQWAQRRLLVIVDQFEQLFTQCTDEEQRQAFVTALHAAAQGHGPQHASAAVVVLGVRADFEARCAEYPMLADAVQGRFLVTPMTERQLRMAITGPAVRAESSVEAGLIDQLLAEIRSRRPGSGAGVLPLLSHALDQAWRNRISGALTLADYERTGGIEGAVAESAQAVYDHLTPAQQAAARRVFTQLTATSADGVDVSSRMTRDELINGCAAAEVRDVTAVLEAFAAERLLVLAADSVEISHEVLLTAWPLLRDTWLAETHADRIVRTRLHSVAADWDQHAHDSSYLYEGSLLGAATEVAARRSRDPGRFPPLSLTERNFVQASEHAHRRRIHQRQGVFAFLTVMVVALAAIATVAVLAEGDAANQRDSAVSYQLAIKSEGLGDTNPVLAKLLSVAAWRIHPSDQARYAMLTADALRGTNVMTADQGWVYSVAYSRNGKLLASGGEDGIIRLWDPATGRQVRKLASHQGEIYSVAFRADGKILASGGDDGTVRLWNVATGRPIGAPLAAHAGEVKAVAFSPDGTTLASATGARQKADGDDDHDGGDGTVRLWNVATGRPIGTPLAAHAGEVSSVAFSRDGKTVASGNENGMIWLWDVATGRQQEGVQAAHAAEVSSVAFSPDGKTLASGDTSGAARLWNVASGQEIAGRLNAVKSVKSVAFSRDGHILATGSDDNTVRLWDAATGQQIGTALTGHTGWVQSVAFSPDGHTLASGSTDHTVRLWNVSTGRPIGVATASRSGSLNSVAFSPDTTTVASAGTGGTIQTWNPDTGRAAGPPITVGQVINDLSFSPDGKILAGADADGTVRLWNVTTRQQIGPPLDAGGGPVNAIAFSPDGKLLASADSDRTIRLWGVAGHRQIGLPLRVHDGAIEAVAFSHNGKLLASGGADTTVRLWDVRTDRKAGPPLLGHVYAVDAVAFSRDDRTLASGSTDYTVRLWRVPSGRPQGDPLSSGTEAVTSVAFSPNGGILASGDADRTVRLWDTGTGKQIGAPLAGVTGKVNSVAFSHDGTTLASAGSDGTVRLWDITHMEDIVPDLCSAAGQTLTRAEWAGYVPSGPHYRNVCP